MSKIIRLYVDDRVILKWILEKFGEHE